MSRKITLTLILLAISLFALNAVNLDGIVFDGSTGEAVEDVEIVIQQENSEPVETVSDETGHFIFSGLETGNYYLSAEAEGFQTYIQELELLSDMSIVFELVYNSNPGELTGHLFGQVMLASGDPAVNATVNIGAFIPGIYPPHISYETITDDNGSYNFENIADFITYEMMIQISPLMPFVTEVEVSGDTEFNVNLPENGGGELTGHLFGNVFYEDGNTASGVEIRIDTWNPSTYPHHQEYTTISGEDGSYELNEIMDLCEYNVAVYSGSPTFFTDVYVDGETEFDIVIEDYEPGEPYSLSGTVVNSVTEETVSGISIMIYSENGIVMETTTNQAGSYLFTELSEGFYILEIMDTPGFHQFNAEIEIFADTIFNIELESYTQGELRLWGVVSEANTGDTLSGIEIILHGGHGLNFTTESTEDGNYEFEDLPEGRYHLMVHGFELDYMNFHEDLDIFEDTEFNIEMQQFMPGELTLNGTITNEDGDPQSELIVQLWGDNAAGWMNIAYTDEDGYYEINEIVAGNYELIVMNYPGMVIFEESFEIQGNMIFNIVLESGQGGDNILSGIVFDNESNDTVPGAHIYIQHGWQTWETESEGDGTYSFADLPSGEFHVICVMEGYEEFMDIFLLEGEGILEIGLIPVQTGDLTLSGTVTNSVTDEAITGVHIQVLFPSIMESVTVTGEDGTYEMNGLISGTCQLMAWTNGWSEYEPFTATINMQDDTIYDFQLTPIEIPGTAEINGVILDEESNEPVAGAYLHLAPVENNPGGGCWTYYETNSDESGNFVFENIAAGEYILAAEAEGYILSYYNGVANPEDATPITVEEDSEITLNITIIPFVFYTVSGTVSDFASGEPLLEASVRALLPNGSWNSWEVAEVITNEDGLFTMEIPEGNYIFRAHYGDPQSGECMHQFYDHKQSHVSADIVSVFEDVSGIDFDLALPQDYDNQISGTITEEGEIPENPVLVAAIDASGSNWEAACVTDMFGNYILSDIPEGEYYILAYEFNSAPTYYPGVIDFQNATTVFASGNVTEIDFELIIPERNGVSQVYGYVRDDDGEPVANANVIISDTEGNVISYAVTNSEGYYLATGLPAGNLDAIATRIFYETDRQNIDVTSTGNADFEIIPEAIMDTPEDNLTPLAYKVSNYPNPFNPVTTINFSLPQKEHTTLDIYNIVGQKVKNLLSESLSSGDHQVIWDGSGDKGEQLSSGMYFYQLKTDNHTVTGKMIMMK